MSEHNEQLTLDQRLLTAEGVAELLAIPRSSVYECARRQHSPLPAIPVGRHRRFIGATSRLARCRLPALSSEEYLPG
jgi:excisionase family DNA binding protein